MTARLSKGQNLAWPGTSIKVNVDVAMPTDLSALLLGPDGRVRSEHDFVFYNQVAAPGVNWTTGRKQELTIDLRTLDVSTVMCLISVDPGAANLGSVTAPKATLFNEQGEPVAEFLITGLTTERAVIAWEIYRRGTAWKVRAVGQGYSGGLAEAVTHHGVEVQAPATPAAQPVPPATAAPLSTHAVATPGTAPVAGRSDDERLYRHAIGIFEDSARSTVRFRSAVSFAEQRRDKELSAALDDPTARNSPAATAARTQAQLRYDDLVTKAREEHRRDIAHLATEMLALQDTLPPPMADWERAGWRNWRPATSAGVAIQAGHLYLPETPDFQIPMLVSLPLSRPLWIDTGGAFNQAAGINSPDDISGLDAIATTSPAPPPVSASRGWQAMTKALVVRLLAAAPIGGLKLVVSDLAGKGASVGFLGELNTAGGLLSAPIATSPSELSTVLTELTERVDLIHMARRANSLDALAGGQDQVERLVILTDFPYGFDDAEIAKVRFLAEEGPSAGVQLLIIGSHGEVEGRGPLTASLFRSFLRLPVEPDDHLGDGWTGTTWTFRPDDGPADGALLDRILGQVAGAREA